MRNVDPYTFVTALLFALALGALAGGFAIGMAFRPRLLDEGERGGSAFRDLLAAAKACADPANLATLLRQASAIWDQYRPDGIHLDTDTLWRGEAGTEVTPAYVHRIVDAYATGDPVNLSGCWVPPDVQGRLRAITIGASEATAALPGRPIPRPTGFITSVHPTDVIERWPVRTGPSDG
ncbi:hypothetical protein [Micromonospora chokoriensis]|uniref:hypothetical protein n=1 Tax=Micromonospora chokoriensis TaxID=356851 RepID=UPI0004C39094|nr:hypothetical protein [Micromonospora chokoriensis]